MAIDLSALETSLGIPSGLYQRVLGKGERSGPTATSKKGAYGTAQLSAAAAQDVGVDRFDPDQNVIGGARYLAQLLQRYGGDVPKAVAAYNAGPSRVDEYGADVPFPETQNYLARVLGGNGMDVGSGAPGAPGTPGGLSADAKGLLQQGQQQVAEQKALTDQEVKGNEQFSKQYADVASKALEKPLPVAPDAPTVPQEQLKDMQHPLEAMGKLLPMIAILGGGLSKRASMGALQAAVGAMEGQKQGDTEARDRAHQEWLDHMKTLTENYQVKRESFDDAMKLYDKDQGRAQTALDILTQQHGMTVANAALRRGDTKAAIDLIKAGLMAESRVASVYERTVGKPEFYTTSKGVTVKFDPAHGGFVGMSDNQPYQMSRDETLTKVGNAPRGGPATMLADFKNEYAQKNGHPPSAAEESQFLAGVGAQSKAEKDFATGKQGQQLQSVNVAIQHLNLLTDLADALTNGDTQRINAMSNLFDREFGSPAPTNFAAAKAIVADEVIKAVVNTGGGVTDRQHAQEQLDAANSPAQLKGVIETSKKLMAGQARGLRKTYESTTGQKNFADRLLPDTVEAMKQAGFDPTEVAGHEPPHKQPDQKPSGAPSDARKAPDGHWYSKNTGPDAKTHPYIRWD